MKPVRKASTGNHMATRRVVRYPQYHQTQEVYVLDRPVVLEEPEMYFQIVLSNYDYFQTPQFSLLSFCSFFLLKISQNLSQRVSSQRAETKLTKVFDQ